MKNLPRHPMSAPMFRRIRGLLILLLITAPGTMPSAFAHGGEIEVGGGGARGPVQLNATQQTASALLVARAGARPLSTLLNLNGEVQLLPNRQADVSLRISGQVKALYANLGDSVRVGQRLVLVQSRLVGDPPPSVTISAPMSGVIDVRNAVVGQAVEPNTVLFHISDRSQVIVTGKVYEEDIGKIKLGQEARVRVLSYPQVFIGKVTLIDPNLDPLSRTVKVWIQLANPQGLLKPNMFARASVILQHNAAALTLPNSAIIEANGEKFVFVREGNKYHRVEVSIGVKDDEYSQITDGVVPGDEVVTQGNREIYTMWLTGSQPKAGE
jgi:cobalt-zinc-cadmium efflux system membrane fusion protein